MSGTKPDWKRVRLITFDAGGTLLAPEPGVGEIYAEVLGKHRITIEPTVLNQRFRAAFKELTAVRPRPVVSENTEVQFWREVVRRCVEPECPAQLTPLIFAKLWEEFATARRWRVLPGVLDTLKALRQRPGLQTAVLSNWDSRLHRTLEALELQRYFARVFISSELGAEKPDARVFRKVEHTLGIPSAQSLHIGDHYAHDYQAARAAGWQALLLAPTPPAEDPQARHIVTLASVVEMLG